MAAEDMLGAVASPVHQGGAAGSTAAAAGEGIADPVLAARYQQLMHARHKHLELLRAMTGADQSESVIAVDSASSSVVGGDHDTAESPVLAQYRRSTPLVPTSGSSSRQLAQAAQHQQQQQQHTATRSRTKTTTAAAASSNRRRRRRGGAAARAHARQRVRQRAAARRAHNARAQPPAVYTDKEGGLLVQLSQGMASFVKQKMQAGQTTLQLPSLPASQRATPTTNDAAARRIDGSPQQQQQQQQQQLKRTFIRFDGPGSQGTATALTHAATSTAASGGSMLGATAGGSLSARSWQDVGSMGTTPTHFYPTSDNDKPFFEHLVDNDTTATQLQAVARRRVHEAFARGDVVPDGPSAGSRVASPPQLPVDTTEEEIKEARRLERQAQRERRRHEKQQAAAAAAAVAAESAGRQPGDDDERGGYKHPVPHINVLGLRTRNDSIGSMSTSSTGRSTDRSGTGSDGYTPRRRRRLRLRLGRKYDASSARLGRTPRSDDDDSSATPRSGRRSGADGDDDGGGGIIPVASWSSGIVMDRDGTGSSWAAGGQAAGDSPGVDSSPATSEGHGSMRAPLGASAVTFHASNQDVAMGFVAAPPSHPPPARHAGMHLTSDDDSSLEASFDTTPTNSPQMVQQHQQQQQRTSGPHSAQFASAIVAQDLDADESQLSPRSRALLNNNPASARMQEKSQGTGAGKGKKSSNALQPPRAAAAGAFASMSPTADASLGVLWDVTRVIKTPRVSRSRRQRRQRQMRYHLKPRLDSTDAPLSLTVPAEAMGSHSTVSSSTMRASHQHQHRQRRSGGLRRAHTLQALPRRRASKPKKTKAATTLVHHRSQFALPRTRGPSLSATATPTSSGGGGSGAMQLPSLRGGGSGSAASLHASDRVARARRWEQLRS